MGKNILIVFVSLVIIASCSKDKSADLTSVELFGTWELTKMSSSWIDHETTGSDMDWQEFYMFKSDSTFSKSRDRNEQVSTASGQFSIKKWHTGEKYIELSFNESSDIVGSCYGNDREELYWIDKKKLASNWFACDGPGLEYLKVK